MIYSATPALFESVRKVLEGRGNGFHPPPQKINFYQ